ncbi:GNAT family N-acetyltransferase [Phenylobacterium sp.]|uniref:GNAT family N-acetyltransferase n=1 Tax=Phenylobacterium sp. TaxID=1871053 RepID=UPI0035638EE9
MVRTVLDLRLATPQDAPAVAEVLQEAARWITTWRSQLWDPALVGEAFVAPIIARGQMLTARTAEGIAGVMILLPEDPHFWPDRPAGEAVYLHKLAVRRTHAGTGVPVALMDHAAGLARAQGRRLMRLDCDPPLASFYRGLGFRGVDEIDVRHPEAGLMRVARMERQVP